MGHGKKGGWNFTKSASQPITTRDKDQTSFPLVFFVFFFFPLRLSFLFLRLHQDNLALLVRRRWRRHLIRIVYIFFFSRCLVEDLWASWFLSLLLVVSESYFHGKWAHWFLLCGCVLNAVFPTSFVSASFPIQCSSFIVCSISKCLSCLKWEADNWLAAGWIQRPINATTDLRRPLLTRKQK